jgi:serine/threonine protein kinase
MKRDDFTFPRGAHIGEYDVLFLIGSGGFGRVYKVVHRATNAVFALKTERLSGSEPASVQREIALLEELDGACFPRVAQHGAMGDLVYLAMPLYGHSVAMVAAAYGHRLPARIALPLAAEMLRVTERLHAHGVVHRDIKPANFLLSQSASAPLVLIDFGVAARAGAAGCGAFVGTKKFASVAAHEGRPLGRRDDLISWFYSAVELFAGELPWCAARSNEELLARKRMPPEELCAGLAPELADAYRHLRALACDAAPDYAFLRGRMLAIAAAQGIELEHFQWQRFYRDHSVIEEPQPPKKACAVC